MSRNQRGFLETKTPTKSLHFTNAESSKPDQAQLFSFEEEINALEADNASSEKQQLELALWAADQSLWIWHRDTNLISVKVYLDGYFNIVEKSESFDDFLLKVHNQDIKHLLSAWTEHVQGNSAELHIRFRYLQKETYVWYELKGKINAFDDSGAQSVIGTFADIDKIVTSQTKLVLMSQAFKKASQPMLLLDNSMDMLEYNDAWTIQLSSVTNKVETNRFTDLVEISADTWDELKTTGHSHCKTFLRLKGSKPIPIELNLSFFNSADSISDYYIALVKDLSESLKTEAKLIRLATQDPVTNLINRRELESRLGKMIEENKSKFDLYFIDLEGVKRVSDALGHQNSDNLLVDIANKMLSWLPDANIIARWGSSEFILVQDASTYAEIGEIIESINDIISTSTFLRNGQKFIISCYVGVSRFPEHAKTANELIRKADAALHYSKDATQANFSVYSEGMAEEIANKIRLVNDLRQALEADDLNFVLQGKYDQERNLVGAELLCRWYSDEHGFVSPNVFIPLIETYGMEYALGISALQHAISYIQKLGKIGTHIPISVNISASQILDVSFHETLRDMLAESQIDPRLIELEVTESVFINNSLDATSLLNKLKLLGVLISLDDFGTGYSSLSYLGQYDFDQVKIDRSFIMEIERDVKAKKLFDAIMNICRALDLDVVVEGVETEKQFSILNSAGVSKFQGFLLGKPINIHEFIAQIQLN